MAEAELLRWFGWACVFYGVLFLVLRLPMSRSEGDGMPFGEHLRGMAPFILALGVLLLVASYIVSRMV